MFSVQRYQAEDGIGSSSRTSAPDRIALINQRKASQQKQAPIAPEASSSRVTLSTSSNETIPASALNSNGIASAARSTASALTIHPSRLAVSQTLRQADRQAKLAASGGIKEKTKAKQRYLKTKKDRRKKRKAAKASKEKKDTAVLEGTAQSSESESESEAGAGPGAGHLATDSEERYAKRQKLDSIDNLQNAAKAVLQDTNADAPSPSASSKSSSGSSSASSASTSDFEDFSKGEAPSAVGKEEVSEVNKIQVEAANASAQEEVKALSRFEAPRRTLQASRKDLATQGLPLGLSNPQKVDPSITISVSKSDHANLNQISTSMKSRLAKIGITEWFAVQSAVIPRLLSDPQAKSLYPNPPLSDLCVSAPTGSGKTLSYAVPVVEILTTRICRRLRALIILPTRELVDQVRDTFHQIIKGTPLSIAALTGQLSFQQEQASLVNADSVRQKKSIPGVYRYDVPVNSSKQEDEICSMVDILITTPGRLLDHLDVTPGFTLQHLRFLIIDEADRLLGQSFQEWLPRLLDALDPNQSQKVIQDTNNIQRLAPAWLLPSAIHKSSSTYNGAMHLQERIPVGVQKLLFSATLTRDPAKILSLQLRNATFISVEMEDEHDGVDDTAMNGNFIDRQESFALPATLREHMIVTKAAEKPLDLLHLLYNRDTKLNQVLCFTKSVENASRLVNLIDLYGTIQEKGNSVIAKEYSSDLNTQRSQILKAFKAKEIDILICSDVMARGIDLPQVRHVISYDVPVDMAKYVHRVGRTARANRQGDAWTLVEEQEARHFKTMMRKGGRRRNVEKVKIKVEERDALREDYEEALARMEQLYSRE